MSEANLTIPAYNGMAPYFFVSYSHADSAVVLEELRWLTDAGYHVWYDEGISPGHDWPDELAKAIENAQLFVLFVTPSSVSSNNCSR